MCPAFIIVAINKNWYKPFYFFGVVWSKLILFFMGFYIKIDKPLDLDITQPYVFVGNHVSMIDVMVMVSVAKRHAMVFVGKKELEKIPIFGYIYRKTMILVDRSSPESRRAVFNSTKEKISKGRNVCLFPEGTVPPTEMELGKFKQGAFSIAIEHQIPIVVCTFLDNKKRFPWSFGGLLAASKGIPGELRVMTHEPISTIGLTMNDMKNLGDKVRKIMLEDLRRG
jgi:1-acyl-sn-glycerol-3-phosphate acyltransferase